MPARMPNVVFVAPFALDTTMRFVRSVAKVPGIRLGIISQEPLQRMPEDLRGALSSYEVVSDALDPDQLTAAIRRLAPGWGGVVDRLVGVLEQLQVPMAQVRERLGLPGMSVGTAQNFRDKSRMKNVLRQNGLPCAAHALAGTREEALAFGRKCGYPLVVKPPDGAGAKHTARVDDEEQLSSFLRTVPMSPAEPILLEEFIIGREHSFDSASVDGNHVFHSISRYYPTPLEVMESPWIQWCVLLPRKIDTPEFDDIREAGRKALDCLGMDTGLTHMEWFRREDGSIAISEVAARPPGAQFTTLLSYAHDRDFYAAWAQLVSTGHFEVPERKFAAGAAFLRGQGAGRVVAVEGIEEIKESIGDLVVEAKLPRYGQSQASSYEGEGYVILRHPETEAVEEALGRLVRTIHVELG